MTGTAPVRVKKVIATAPLRPGEGRECSLPSCVALATGASYDDVMGASGAAFATTIDADGWDPIAATPLDEVTLARAAAAAGVRTDAVVPPFEEDMRALVLDRVIESIEAALPPLVRGAVGPSEYGLIVGVDDREPTFFARTYFDAGDDPTRVGWDAFAGPGRGDLVFLDRSKAPDRATLARDAIARAAADADASDEALRAWLAALRDETRWAPARAERGRGRNGSGPKHGGAMAFADHTMRTILADKRRAAARFLRSVREAVPARVGAELLRAAEAYDKVAAAAEKVGAGPFDPAVALRFVEGGHRRAWANALDAILRHEAEAHDAMRAARA